MGGTGTMTQVKIFLHRFSCFLASSILLHHVFLTVPTLATTFSETEQNAAIEKMLSDIGGYGLKDIKTLQAMGRVSRHKFVPEEYRKFSYSDTPLKIGYGQTISQPYIVAEMTKQLQLSASSKVLEIGTGSGYQAAVLAEMTPHVYSVEIIEPLLIRAGKTLAENGYLISIFAMETDIMDGPKRHPLMRSLSPVQPVTSLHPC